MKKFKSSMVGGLTIFILFFCLTACVTQGSDGKIKAKNIDKTKLLSLEVQMSLGYIDAGNREMARQHLKKAFGIDSGSAAATDAMAKLYLLEGEHKLAEEEFKKAIRLDKKFTLSYSSYGIFLFNQKRYEEALKYFEIAAADLSYGKRAQVLTNLGKAAVKLGNNARAQSAFEHAIVLDRNNAETYLELAELNLIKQDYADAKRNLDAYGQLTGHSPRSLLLGIRLERVFGNKDKEASLALMLKSGFPYSKEYLEYKNSIKN